MSGGVFVLKDQGQLVELPPAAFPFEADFQKLLAEHPALLAGDQIDPSDPRRWILVSREKEVPSEEGGTGTWSVDHLFLDQDGVPTFVEVKLRTNTDLRRKVVGQMLEYAANSIAYWPADELRRTFEARHKDPDAALLALVGSEIDAEAYWLRVKTNLAAGRVRLLFVADYIPPQLRRIVEFLNEQMDPAEVLAVELRQYGGAELRTVVPVVYGQTTEARGRKGTGGGQRNYEDVETYDGIKAKCRDLGDRIVVGFLGGVRRLRQNTPVQLAAKREFKWDWLESGTGKKTESNWIPGSVFLEEALRVEGQIGASPARAPDSAS